MLNEPSEPAAQLARFMSALQRQWREELGAPEAAATEAVLKKAQALLTAARDGSVTGLLAGSPLADYFGEEWLGANPWARPHIHRMEGALREPQAL